MASESPSPAPVSGTPVGMDFAELPTDPGIPTDTLRSQPAGPPPWRSLHPLSLLANLVPQAWNTARAAWPLLLAVFVGGGSMGMEALDLSLLSAFFGLNRFVMSTVAPGRQGPRGVRSLLVPLPRRCFVP